MYLEKSKLGLENVPEILLEIGNKVVERYSSTHIPLARKAAGAK